MEVFFSGLSLPDHRRDRAADGKTTTTTIIAGLLKAVRATAPTWAATSAHPLLAEASGRCEPEDMAVLELSSFQLMTMDQSPDIAVVTNLAPNHLDVHKDMQRVCGRQGRTSLSHQSADEQGWCSTADNDITRGLCARRPAGRVDCSSAGRRSSARGVCLRDGAIWRGQRGACRRCWRSRTSCCPASTTWRTTWQPSPPWTALCTGRGHPDLCQDRFGGVEHRIELVRTLNGVRYYNDSIASSPVADHGRACAPSTEKVILIAGGYDKHIPFDVLGPEVVAQRQAPDSHRRDGGQDQRRGPRVRRSTARAAGHHQSTTVLHEAVTGGPRHGQAGGCGDSVAGLRFL